MTSSSFSVNREELAWAAGFFDGEGHVSSIGPNFTITIPQVGREVLDRFRAAVGLGKVYGPYTPRHKNHQPQHRYHATGHPRVQAVCALLWRWLSPVKREQFRTVLTARRLRAHSRYRPTTCAHGQRTTKTCVVCHRAWSHKYQATEYGKSATKERQRVYQLTRKTAHALLVAV